MTQQPTEVASNPYSTGGGGVVFEHRYAALVLSRLLDGSMAPELDGGVLDTVTFQSAEASIDDLRLNGRRGSSDARALVGARRNPRLVASDPDSSKLIGAFAHEALRAEAGTSLVLVSVASRATAQLRSLTTYARAHADAAAFHAWLDIEGHGNASVKARLAQVTSILEKEHPGLDSRQVAWSMLRLLRVQEVRIEEGNDADLIAAAERMDQISHGRGRELLERMEHIADEYIPSGATMARDSLRRLLADLSISGHPSVEGALEVLSRLLEQSRSRTSNEVGDSRSRLSLVRAGSIDELASRVNAAADALVVTGDPDVGKSALSFRALNRLADVVVHGLNLRDLPTTMVEFENALGASLKTVLQLGPTAPTTVLLVDGAEAILEDGPTLFEAVCRAAFDAGVKVIAVTRLDGSEAVQGSLRSALQQRSEPSTVQIEPLEDLEIKDLVEIFPMLHSVYEDDRSRWLLSRPGLVDALLKAPPGSLEAGPLSEADVFSMFWTSRVATSPNPDERDQAMRAIAGRLLGEAAPIPSGAMSGLRSDGLLQPLGSQLAWSPRTEFGHDLVRDFSVARLLTTDGMVVLQRSAPRWAFRAAKLAAQAKLLSGRGDLPAVWRDLKAQFALLAKQWGERWLEVPYEALLTCGPAQELLEELWPTLREEDGGLGLLRLANQRFNHSGFGDFLVLAPVVDLAFCSAQRVSPGRYNPSGTGRLVREVVLAWLAAMLIKTRNHSVLRQKVRDRLLEDDVADQHEFSVRAIATLAEDLDDNAKAYLRQLPHPWDLNSALEDPIAIASLGRVDPDLLAELAKQYYVIDPDSGERDDYNEGIRDLHHGSIPSPMAGPYFGPFWTLINQAPVQAIDLIQSMLNRAAMWRARYNGDPPLSLELDLPGKGPTTCFGDDAVWYWYRGSSVGPYPCMSALMALEAALDGWLSSDSVSVESIAAWMFRGCENLAMPGLFVGLLARHRGLRGNLLDGFLAVPEVWHLEVARVVHEGTIHVQGRDRENLVGKEYRRTAFMDIAADMAITAHVRGDQARLGQLADIARTLRENAATQVAENSGPGAKEYLATVAGWAGAFDPVNYAARAEGSDVIIQYERPQEVVAVLADELAATQRINESYAVQARHLPGSSSRTDDKLASDIDFVRSLEAEPLAMAFRPNDLPAMVAADAVLNPVDLDEDRVDWAIKTLIAVAASKSTSDEDEQSLFSMGEDRSAARALPSTLLWLELEDQLRSRVLKAIEQLSLAGGDEVRGILAKSERQVWSSPCRRDSSGRCVHERLWDSMEGAVEDCALGPWRRDGHRAPRRLDPPFDESLVQLSPGDVLLSRLVPAFSVAAYAAHAECVRNAALARAEALLSVCPPTEVEWAQHRYSTHWVTFTPLGEALLDLAAQGHASFALTYVAEIAVDPGPLQRVLHDLAVAATYRADLRPALSALWPTLMSNVMGVMETAPRESWRSTWEDWAIPALIPLPQITSDETDVDARLDSARQGWVRAASIDALFDQWLTFASGMPRAVEAVARLAILEGDSWAPRAFELIERLISTSQRFSNTTPILVDWLGRIRSVIRDRQALASWLRIVDVLASQGDRTAIDLQRTQE